MAHGNFSTFTDHGSELSNRRASLNEMYICSPESEDSALATRHTKPLPPPERFVRRGKVSIKPPAGPSEEHVPIYIATVEMSIPSTDFTDLDDPYDGILEALME